LNKIKLHNKWMQVDRVVRPQVRWYDIVGVNYYIRVIVHFGGRSSITILSLKGVGGLRKEDVFKLTLASIPRRCGNIEHTETSAPVEG